MEEASLEEASLEVAFLEEAYLEEASLEEDFFGRPWNPGVLVAPRQSCINFVWGPRALWETAKQENQIRETERYGLQDRDK